MVPAKRTEVVITFASAGCQEQNYEPSSIMILLISEVHQSFKMYSRIWYICIINEEQSVVHAVTMHKM